MIDLKKDDRVWLLAEVVNGDTDEDGDISLYAGGSIICVNNDAVIKKIQHKEINERNLLSNACTPEMWYEVYKEAWINNSGMPSKKADDFMRKINERF